MELVFERDGKTMERAYGFLVLGKVCIKLLRIGNSCIKEDLVKAIQLKTVSTASQLEMIRGTN